MKNPLTLLPASAVLSVALTSGAAFAQSAAPAGKTAAHFKLPPATYQITPPPFIRDTTALRPTKLRGPIYLPMGAQNVALGKTVTSSDDAPIIGKLKMLTDGDKNPAEGSWLELAPGKQWIQIDLGQAYKIHGVLFWHYPAQVSRVYRDVVVQVADDADFVENVRTVFNNDQDNSSGLGAGKDREFYELREGQWIPFEQTARFVRFYSKGNSSDKQNQYTEAEVWASLVNAVPLQSPPPKATVPKPAAKVAPKPKVAAKSAKTKVRPSPPPGTKVAPFVLPPATYQ